MIAKTVLPIKFEQSSNLVTAHGDLIIFDEFMTAMGLTNLVGEHMPQPGSNRGFEPYKFVRALALTMYGGGKGITETKELRDDTALKIALGLGEVPSESAMGDWLRRMGDSGGIEGMMHVNDVIVKRALKESELKEITLVSDPSIIKAEKRDAAMTYVGIKGYRPHFIFIKELGLVAGFEFRDGNDTGRRLDPIKRVYNQLSSQVKIKSTLLDSEFYQSDIISFFNVNKVDWTIAADLDSSVKAQIAHSSEWQPFIDRHNVKTDREITEAVHAMEGVEDAFRLIVMRWPDEKKPGDYKYHAIATANNDLKPCGVVLRYNTRATEENVIKESKYGFGMNRMPCGSMKANAIYFAIGLLTQNLFVAQKIFTMPKDLQRMTIGSVRWLLSAAMQLVTDGNALIVRVFTYNEKFLLINNMRKKNYAFSVKYADSK